MFQTGFARLDITPPLGTPIAGYFYARIADGVLDPLELCALAVKDDETTAVFLAADIIYAKEVEANKIRKLVAERCGIPFECVFIQGLHQHTSIRVGGPAENPTTCSDPHYLDVLFRKYADAAQMAIDDLCDSRMGVAEKETPEQLSFVRRYRMKDGSTRTNPGCLNPDVVAPLSDPDNTVRLVRFFREGKKDIALVNFSTHPDVIGGNKFSADWPGFVRRNVEADLPDVHCILVNGCQGDVNHVDVFRPAITQGIKKGEPGFVEKRYAHAKKMGRIIADTAISVWDKTVEKQATPVSAHNRIDYIPTNTEGMGEEEESRELLRKHESGEQKLSIGPFARAKRILGMVEDKLYQKVPTALLGIGEVAIAGIAGEPFTWYATTARASAPDLFVITACLVNGGEGYLPTKEAFEEGGYEAGSTRFTPCVAEKIPASIKDMLDEHKAKM